MKGKPTNQNCPVCNQSLNIDTYVPGAQKIEPVDVETDDITFCFKCRSVLVFDEQLNIVVPDEETLYYITHDPSFHRFISEIDNARKNKPSLN